MALRLDPPTDLLEATTPAEPSVLWLDDALAGETRLTGAKASNLARARRDGLPVLDGFVVTTVGTSSLDTPESVRAAEQGARLRTAWSRLSRDGAQALAVRSSSLVEDSTTSSMAGRFVSVLHVQGWGPFVDAVFEVVASAASTELGDAPMAVLVQPMADARAGGVLFGLDPLTGDRSSYLASVTDGLPDQIVGGATTGTQIVLGPHGRSRSVSGPLPAALTRRHRRRLARLARSTRRLFGGPQDMEWLIDSTGRLRLLQSRPITASALPPERSHLLGPGPVAETFPDPLSPLERDLWEPPLDDGIREALRISGAAGHRALTSRFVVDVDGRVAVDLEALGAAERRRAFWHRFDPRPPARKLRAAWRIGRLRSALPGIAHDLVRQVDADLAAVPAVATVGDLQLLTVLINARQTLGALHAHEVLAGFFLDDDVTSATGASVALGTLARARADGLTDHEIVERHPVTLALVPPRVGGGSSLPATATPFHAPAGVGADRMAVARESLRLRARWVQELTAVAAAELGGRLAGRRQLRSADDVRALRLAELCDLVHRPDALGPAVAQTTQASPPLPARFRLAADGTIVPDLTGRGGDGAPIGVSRGRAQATVTHDPGSAAGRVLVVRSLDADLAGVLGTVAGLVSETGSPLSHLAILAREYGVPVVVGVDRAVEVLGDGDLVLVDGSAGVVEPVGPDPSSGAAAPARWPAGAVEADVRPEAVRAGHRGAA